MKEQKGKQSGAQGMNLGVKLWIKNPELITGKAFWGSQAVKGVKNFQENIWIFH